VSLTGAYQIGASRCSTRALDLGLNYHCYIRLERLARDITPTYFASSSATKKKIKKMTPGLHADGVYEFWEPTIDLLLDKGIKTAFTVLSKEEYVQVSEL